jgi:hypothetical protein
MTTENILLSCVAGYLFCCTPQYVAAQEPSCNATMTYENHSQVDPKPLTISYLE